MVLGSVPIWMVLCTILIGLGLVLFFYIECTRVLGYADDFFVGDGL